MLNAEQIAGSKDFKIETVEVEEWGGSVCLRSMSTGDASTFQERTDNEQSEMALAAFLVCRGLCDEDGNRILGDDGEAMLMKKDRAIVNRLAERVVVLSGLSAEVIEEEEKN